MLMYTLFVNDTLSSFHRIQRATTALISTQYQLLNLSASRGTPGAYAEVSSDFLTGYGLFMPSVLFFYRYLVIVLRFFSKSWSL